MSRAMMAMTTSSSMRVKADRVVRKGRVMAERSGDAVESQLF